MPSRSFVCIPWRGIAGDLAAWDALSNRAAEPNPFFESWYLLPSLEAFDPEGDVELLCYEEQGRLCGLLPIVRRSRYYRYPIPNLSSWLHDNCFLGSPLVARGCEHGFFRALFRWADRNAGTALFLHLSRLPLAGPLHTALLGVCHEQNRTAALVHHEERALLASDQAPETYFEAAMSAKKRKELRRQYNRLSELGDLRFDRREDSAGLDRWLGDFLALEAAGWKGKAGSALASARATERLFTAALRSAAERGKLERLTLSLDGKPLAMLATFLTPPGAFSFKTAFDEGYARFSPGVLLQRENLAMLDRKDVHWTDSCAAADHPMIDHIWHERRAIGRLSIAIGGKMRRALFSQLARRETVRIPQTAQSDNP